MNAPDKNSAEDKPNDYDQWQRDRKERRRAFVMGIVISNLIGMLTMLVFSRFLSQWGSILQNGNVTTTFVASQFIALPMGMGIVASYFWRDINLTPSHTTIGSLWITALALLSSFIFLNEGALCIVMVSPLLFFVVWTGVAFGKFLWKRNPWLGASTLPLLAAMLIADSQMPHHHAAIVVDEVLIHASPAQVWRYVASYPAIEAPPDYWLWKIGLPVPVQSTSQGAFVGAKRDCRFSGNIVFEEKIIEVKQNKLLTFDVTKQPDHPEINGHFNLDRGRFELRDNGDGTTTLIGTTWYRLHVYPSQYFDLWASDIIRRVHFRVMYHIQELAERDAQKHHRILPNRK